MRGTHWRQGDDNEHIFHVVGEVHHGRSGVPWILYQRLDAPDHPFVRSKSSFEKEFTQHAYPVYVYDEAGIQRLFMVRCGVRIATVVKELDFKAQRMTDLEGQELWNINVSQQ